MNPVSCAVTAIIIIFTIAPCFVVSRTVYHPVLSVIYENPRRLSTSIRRYKHVQTFFRYRHFAQRRVRPPPLYRHSVIGICTDNGHAHSQIFVPFACFVFSIFHVSTPFLAITHIFGLAARFGCRALVCTGTPCRAVTLDNAIPQRFHIRQPFENILSINRR